MKRIKPKWLLGAMVVALAVAAGPLVAEAAVPALGAIVSPTDSPPAAVASGNNVWVEFTYTSEPSAGKSNTTSATIEVTDDAGTVYGTRAYAYPTIKDTNDPTVVDYDPALPGVQFIGNVTVTAPNGLYNVRVTVTNGDGSDSDVNYDSVLVDNSLPSAVSGLAVFEDFDGDGVPGNAEVDATPDGYLKDMTPTFNWTAATDDGNPASGIAEYHVWIDADPWIDTNSASTSYTAAVLATGSHTFKVKAFDNAGNEGPEASISFTIDTTPLAAPTMNPEPVYTPGDSNAVSWTNPSGACGVQVAIDDNNNQADGFIRSEASIYLDPEEPPTSTEFFGLEDGHQYWYYARSQDLAGNWSGWSSAVTSTQDATAPAVDVTAPADGTKTFNTTPGFTATASDVGSGIASVEFEYSSNGGTTWNDISTDTDGSDGYAAVWGAVTLPDGSIILKATATNGAGTPASDQVTITVDTSPPVVNVTAPADGAKTSDTTPDFTANATDDGSGVASVKFEYSSDGGTNWTTISTDTNGVDGYAADWSAASLPNGSIILRATATNGAGTPASAQVTITVDTSPPVVDVTAPTDGTKTANTKPTFEATATDDGSGIASVKFEYSSNGGADWTTISTDTNGVDGYAADWSAASLPNGSIILKATATNGAGTPASDQVTITVDTSPPTVNVTAPGDDAFVSTRQPAFTASASDPVSGIASVLFQYSSNDGGTWNDISTDTDGSDGYAAVWGAIYLTDQAPHKLRATATNGAGLSTTTDAVDIRVDTTPPTVAITAPPDGVVTNNDTPLFTADAHDDYSGVLQVVFQYSADDGSTWNTISADDAASYAADWGANNLPDGLIVLKAIATNGAGIPAFDEVEIFVDTVAPGTPGVPVAGNLGDDGKWYINTLWPTFTWDASVDPEPSSGLRDYTFQFGTGPKPNPTDPDPDTWAGKLFEKTGIPPAGTAVEQWTTDESIASWGVVAGEAYLARVKAYDKAGNESLWTDPPIIYDPDPPTTPGVPSTTTPTTDVTPEWTWDGSTDDISGVDLYQVQIRRQGSSDWDVLDTFVDIPDSTTPDDPETWEQGLQLESGTYEIHVRAIDVAGNYSDWSDEGSVTIHATPPDPPVMTPEDDTKDLPLVEWSEVEDPGYTVSYVLEYATNEAFSGATQVACATNSHSFTALTDGTYWMRAKAVVLVNDMGTSADPSDDLTIETGWAVPISFTYDAGLPSVPAALQVVTPATDNTPMFVWNASEDETSGVAFYRLQYTAEGGAPVTVDTTAPEWTATSVWADGFYDVQVKAIDAVGNESEYCTAIDVMIDTQAPDTPELTELEEYTPGTSVTVEWGAVGDDTSGVAYYEVQMGSEEEPFEVDKTAIVEEDGSEACTYTFDNLEPGATYYYRVRAVDEVGNGSEWSSVEFSTQYPAAPCAPGLEVEPEFTAGLANTIYWQSADGADDYDVQVSTVEDFSLIAKDLPDVGNVTQLLVTGLTDGTKYFYRVRGHAHVGDVDEVAGPWSNVVSSTQDNSGPAAPSALKVLTPASDSRPAFMWNASDDGEAGSGVATYELQYKREGTDWESDDVVSIVTREAQWVAESAFAEGSYLVRVRATDAVGNAGGFSEEVAFTIDTTPPTVVFINPTEAEGVTYDITTSSTIIAEITGEFDQHKVWLSIDGGGEVTPTAIVGSTVYYVVGVPFTADEHTVAIRVQDAAGNEGSAEVTFTVEAYRQGFGFGRLRFENTVEPED